MNRKYTDIFIGLTVLCGLYITGRHSYILFHTSAELFTIGISFAIFAFAWNTRRFGDNNFYLFLGIAFLFVGFINIFHTLAYKGMGVFLPSRGSNLPTQLWVAMRSMTAVSFFISPFFIGKKINITLIFAGFAAVVSFFLAGIFYFNVFPDCFIDGQGLTPFKILSEYAISLIFAGSIFTVLKKRQEFESKVLELLLLSIAASIVAELFFTFYIDAYGLSNFLGHYFILISFYLMYKAILETGLTKPYDILFKELKKSEEVLRESDNFSQSLLQTIPFGMDIIDEQGNILFINKNLENLLGKEIIGKKCWETYKDDKKRCIDCPLMDNIQLSDTAAIEAEGVFDGKTLQITHTGMLYKGKRAVLEIFEDITKRKRAEQRIKHLASFPELNPNPVLELNLSGEITFYNDAAGNVLKDSGSAPAADVFIPSDLQEIIKTFREKKTNLVHREVKVVNTIFREDIFYVPQIDKLRIYATDITELMKAEESLKNDNLRLHDLDKKKSEFVSIVAHDLRTPLTSIMGFADTITKKNLNLTEEQKETFIGYIQEESRRLSRLISDYLDISNIDEGKFELNLKKTDLKQVVIKTVEMFTANAKNIRLSAEFAADLPELKLDRDRIRQVLQNLMDNAIKYSPAGSSVSVVVKKNPNEIRVSVSDEGPGIPDNEKEKIFLKFYRASSSASKEAPGTGLGLTISKSIVERHKGKIWTEDNSPAGSSLIFTLPVND